MVYDSCHGHVDNCTRTCSSFVCDASESPLWLRSPSVSFPRDCVFSGQQLSVGKKNQVCWSQEKKNQVSPENRGFSPLPAYHGFFGAPEWFFRIRNQILHRVVKFKWSKRKGYPKIGGSKVKIGGSKAWRRPCVHRKK